MFNVCWQLLPKIFDIPTRTWMYVSIILLVDRGQTLINNFYEQFTF